MNRIRLLLVVSGCAGFAQQTWSELREGEIPPPELGVTEVVGTKKSDRDVSRKPASMIEMNFASEKTGPVTDAEDVVRYDPGVSIPFDIAGADPFVPYGNNGFSSYQIRGVGGNRLLLTIDGIRQPPEYDQAGGMGRTFFDPRVYGGVQILKGTGSAQFGSEALGGAIGFRSKSLTDELEYSPRPWLLQGSTTLKSVDQSINGLVRAGVRGGDMYITATDSYTDGHEVENAKGDVEANPLDFQQNHFLSTVSWIPSEQNRVWVTGENFLYHGKSRLKSSEVGRVNYVGTENTNERSRVSMDYLNTPDAGWWDQLSAKGYIQQSENNSLNNRNSYWVDAPPFPGLDPSTNTIYRTDRIGFSHDLVGGTLALNHLFDTGAFEHNLNYGMELGYEHGENSFNRDLVQNGIPMNTDAPTAFDPSDLHRAEFYIEDSVARGRWNVIGGVRLTDYRILPGNDPDYLAQTGSLPKPDYENRSLSPSASVDYQPSENTLLWGRYAHGVRNPSLEDYVGYFDHELGFYRVPNPNLEAESSDAFETGARFGHTGISVDASLFYTFYDGFIEERETGVVDTDGKSETMLMNVGQVDIYGAEAGIDLWPAEWGLPLEGISTGMKMVYTDGKNQSENDEVDSVEPFEAVIYVGYDHVSGKWGTRLTGIYRAQKKAVSQQWTAFIPPSSFVVDWTGYWNITPRISLVATIRNLTDQKYWVWPNAGRSDHTFNENPELAVQPGINGILELNIAL
ncbi:TonB-dependent receptor [Pontiellaceae bacterium B1224]|nr:TonB-dependent receptor [Pontiellaceae bacterium B1224]